MGPAVFEYAHNDRVKLPEARYVRHTPTPSYPTGPGPESARPGAPAPRGKTPAREARAWTLSNGTPSEHGINEIAMKAT